jgi:hypothetical protein
VKYFAQSFLLLKPFLDEYLIQTAMEEAKPWFI